MSRTEKNVPFSVKFVFAVLALFVIEGCAGGAFSFLKSSDKQALKDLRVLDLKEKTEVVVRGQEPLEYSVVSLQNPPRLVVNLLSATRGPFEESIRVEKGNIQEIKLTEARKRGKGVTMEIMLHQAMRPKVREENNGLVFEFQPIERNDDQKVVEEYRIGPEDTLEIMVWKNDDLSRTVTVRPDGKISLPLIGDIKASGLSTKELDELIASRLEEYINTPEVSILVKEIKSYYFYILGEVINPGKYPLKESTTVLQAISMAGGFTPFAAKNGLSLFRKHTGTASEKKYKIRYDDIISADDPEKNLRVQSRDTIVVP